MTDLQTSHHGNTQDDTQGDAGVSRGDSSIAPADSGAETTTPRSLRRLTCVSVTHRTHSTDLVGRLGPDDPVDVAARVHENDRVTDAMVLATCNRVEVYVSTRTPDFSDHETALAAIGDHLDLPFDARIYTGREVVAHLARVTAGLDSAVLGEEEIAGQVSDALAAAKQAGLAAGVFGRVGNTALRAGRKCRAETDIDEGTADYGSAVCNTIADELDGAPARLLVIGAGTMAKSVVGTATARWDVHIDVANRSAPGDLPTAGGSWWTLSELSSAVGEADAVVCATDADQPVFEASHAARCQDGTPVVDLGTPADVAPAVRTDSTVSVTDLDTLATTVNSGREGRRAAVVEAESVISSAVDRLVERERENRAEDVIRALHQEAAEIRTEELERAKRRLAEGDAETEAVLEDLTSAVTGRLLGPATAELRTAARERDETALRAARRLFDLDGGEQP